MPRRIFFDDIFNLLVKNNLLSESSFRDSEKAKPIEYIAYNSKDITAPKNKISPQKTLYFCKGNAFKEEYLTEVLNAGIKYYVSEKKYNVDDSIEYFIVNDIRRAIAVIVSFFYGNPNERLNIIGVTGTKGKSTTAYFLTNILNEHKKKSTASISSLEINTGKRKESASLSTPEAFELHRYFYEAVESGCESIVTEVSSQAYKTDRVYGVRYKYGLFLNISEDHISPIEHTDFNDYLNCKLRIFPNSDVAVINRDMDFYEIICDSAKKSNKVIVFGSEKHKDETDYYFCNVTEGKTHNTFTVKNDKLSYECDFKIKMLGTVNIENAIAAIAVAHDMGVSNEAMQKAVYNTKTPGRMEIYEKDGITVVVDYAHNFLSFKRLFASLKENYKGQKLISVGGTVGGKCYNRRKEFASEVGKNSHKIYLTADDPANEKVEDICAEVASYMENKNYEIIPDRKNAIEKAIAHAEKGDVVILLSKGVETTQKVNGKSEPYEGDMKLAKKAFSKRKEYVNI